MKSKIKVVKNQSNMEHIPLHLFDFYTLTKIQIINKRLRAQARIQMKSMHRTKEILKYTSTLTRDTRYVTIQRLSSSDVWHMFNILYQQRANTSTPPRYSYIVSPMDNVHMNVYHNASHPYGMFLMSHNQIRIGTLPQLFGAILFNFTITETLHSIRSCLDVLAFGIGHTLIYNDIITTWDAWNLSLVKIDTYRRKIFLSEQFSVKSGEYGLPIISTYFPHKQSNAIIRDIVFAMSL